MWSFALRRITSLMILTCAVVVIFLAILYFPGLNKVPLFKRRTISSEIIQLEEPVVLEQAGYAMEDEGVMMKELFHPSAPDLFPTPRRPRRGTSDSTSGTSEIVNLYKSCYTHKHVSSQNSFNWLFLLCCYQVYSIRRWNHALIFLSRDCTGLRSPKGIIKVIPQYCIAHPYCTHYLHHVHAHEHVCLQNLRDFPQTKKFSEGKKILTKVCSKPLLQHTNYDYENNNSTNALRPHHLKWCDLSPNFIWYCSICSALATCQVFSQVLL